MKHKDVFAGAITRCTIHRRQRLDKDNSGSIQISGEARDILVEGCVLRHPIGRIRANGEAEANKIRQTSLTPQLLELRKIENQKALIERWNGQLPTVQTGNGGLLMELPKMQQ